MDTIGTGGRADGHSLRLAVPLQVVVALALILLGLASAAGSEFGSSAMPAPLTALLLLVLSQLIIRHRAADCSYQSPLLFWLPDEPG